MADPRTILVVEDDRDIRDSLVEALESVGYSANSAFDGLDALEKLQQGPPPDVILLDLMMPRMNGMEFHAELMRVADWSTIPVIVLSADAQGRSKARALGATGFLMKPVKLKVLLELIGSVLADNESANNGEPRR